MTNPSLCGARMLAFARAHACRALLLSGFGLLAQATAAQTNIVGNGSFETPSVNGQSQTLNAGSTLLGPWSIGGHSIDVIKNFWTSKHLTQSIDLDGNAPGSISQTLTTVPGKTYTLTFWYSSHPSLGSTPASMTVSWGPATAPNSAVFTFTGPSSKSNMGWKLGQATIQATSNATVLTFQSNSGTNSNYGIALDDVRVVSLTQTQAPLTVAVTPSPLVYGTTGTATTSGGSGTGTVTFSAGASTGCSVSGSTVSVTNASGTCAITATKAGDASYDPITSAPLTVTLARGSQQTLAITAPASVTYGSSGTATASGGSGTGALTFSSGSSTGCAVSGTTVSVTNASGTCSITAAKAGDNNYNATTSAAYPVTLAKANQATLSVTGPTSLSYGVPGTATATGGSGTGALTFSAGLSTGCTVSGTTVSVTNANGTCAISAAKAGDDNYNAATTSSSFSPTLPTPFATPVLIRAVTTDSITAWLIGRVDGAPSLPISVQAYTASTCTDGTLNAPAAAGLPVTVTTDPSGYFGASFASIPAGHFVVIEVRSPTLTARSACLVSSADNDSWPKALNVLGNPGSARDYIDAPGRARWYKFSVLPGQRVQVTLSGLPGDYDLAVFKDIEAAFYAQLTPANTGELTKLSAEYAPSVFSPSVFSPSVFSPSVFSPDAYAPSVFSPSVFSPSVFSPSVFSPSVFSPSVFSPSVFSPSVFSPSVFSPSVFSPSVFSPSVFSPSVFSTDELAMAFSSAQTRSIIGVSATPGTGDETVVVNTWSNTGNFYVRVAGRAGAYSTAGQFSIDVAKDGVSCTNVTDTTLTVRAPAAGAAVTTLILTDSSKVALDAALPGGGTLRSKLAAFAARTEIGGVVVDVGDIAAYPRVDALKTQAASNAACPYATNLVAEEIKGIVDSYRPNNPLRYVVIAGNDGAIPYFRYPDQSLLGQESGYVPPVVSTSASEASLRTDHVLSQDAYGSGTRVSLRTSAYPVPGLAVGRLVETPNEIAGMIDAYISAGGVVAPATSLVTGYDFLEDAANSVRDELASGTGATVNTLITPNGVSPEDARSWTATDLGAKLLGATRHDVIFLAGHFSANSALAADFTTSLLTTDLQASTTNFTNAIVFSAGCHSGYNIVDADAVTGVTEPLDWAQAFSRKQATLIAGTGYQYGDTDFLEYSERIYANFARQLRAGAVGTSVAVGEALVKAKLDYLATTPDIRGIHEKALLEATLFGLPMLGVNMPAGRGPVPGADAATIVPTPVAAQPAQSLGLKSADLRVAPALVRNTKPLTNVEPTTDIPSPVTAEWYVGPQGVVTNPAEPALPLAGFNVTPTTNGSTPDPSLVLRGVGFRGGEFADSTIIPLTGAPTNELRGVHVPFVSPVFFPMRSWTVNYFGALGGNGTTSLLVTPAQHRAKDIALGTSTLRKYSNLDVRLFYSGNLGSPPYPDAPSPSNQLGNPSLSDAPTIVSVLALPAAGAGVEFTAKVVGDPKAAIHEVWVTYTSDGVSKWQSLDLQQCLAISGPCTAVDSQTWKGTLATLPANIRYVVQAVNGYGLVTLDDNLGVYYTLGGSAQAATTATLVSTPPSATFGDTKAVTANLKSGSTPLANKNVIVAIGGAARVGTTDSSGNVTVNVPLVSVPGSYRIIASYGGDADYLPSSASAGPITVAKAPTSLAALSLASATSTLTATIGGKDQPLMQEAVTFVLTNASNVVLKTIVVITDYLGKAKLPPTGLPAGTYKLTASFAGNATYTPVTTTAQDLVITPQTITFSSGLPPALGYPGSTTYPASATFTASSSSGSPVTVTLAPGSSAYCTLTGGPTYTLTAIAVGTCTIAASAAGTVTIADVNITKDIPVKTEQTINFGPLGNKKYGDPDFTLSATSSSNLPVTFTSSTTGVCTVSGNSVHIAGVGTCTITADQAGDTRYFPAPPVARSFTVGKAAQSISFATIPGKIVSDAPFAISASATSGLAVTFASATATLCTVAGNTVTLLYPGTCVIRANQAGDGNYEAAPEVTQSVAVAMAPQTINFPPIPDKTLDQSPVSLATAATASSGLTVTYTASGNCAVVSGTSLTLTGVGSCAVTASQPGNGYYNAATPVSRTFLIGLANVWKPTGPMTLARSYHTATPLADGTGRVLIAGGLDQYGASTASTEIYNPATQTFVSAGNMPSKSASHAAVRLNDGRVLVTGGGNSSAQIYTPNAGTGTWAPAGSLSSNRSYHTATVLPSGKVLIIGGADNAGKTTGTTIVYNPATGNFTNGPTMDTSRERHTATLVTSGANAGKVLVVGGRVKVGNNYQTRATYQFCDATTCTSSQPGIAGRHSHAAVELVYGVGDTDVLVTGGADGSSDLASSDRYDGAAWSSSGIGLYTMPRRELTVSELPNGRAIVAGGRTGTAPQAAADVYAPPFGPAPPMGVPRAGHTATSLRDASGNIVGVLVTGGVSTSGVSVNTAETYGIP